MDVRSTPAVTARVSRRRPASSSEASSEWNHSPGVSDIDPSARSRRRAGAARLLARSIPAYESAEQRAAEWLEAEAALLFPTGFQANLGTIASLTDRGDAIFSDRLNHASLIDATRMSRAEVHVHEHLDLGQLDEQLAHASGARRRLVVTEGVFSMDGDAAPIAALAIASRDDGRDVVVAARRDGSLWSAELDEGDRRGVSVTSAALSAG